MKPPPASPSRRRLRHCLDCGLVQAVPPLRSRLAAHCRRCDGILQRGGAEQLAQPLALSLAGVLLLVIAATANLMDVSNTGIERSATLLTGPKGLESYGLWELSVVVVFTTIAAPAIHLLGTAWVLLALHLPHPPNYLRRLFGWMRRLRPWSMVEVYLVGLFVAYTRLRSMVHIDTGAAIWALLALMLVMITADAVLDPDAVWQQMTRRGIAGVARRIPPGAPLVGCDVCGIVADASTETHCPRCQARLHRRKPDSLNRTWALTLTATILYIPANTYPILTYITLGAGAPSTILGGARELLEVGQWPLALLVFVASIAVPVLKLAGLYLMLITTRFGLASRLRDRTVVYRVVEVIGRWSMIDIFMESILVALVQFGGLARVEPGVGAVAFASVVVLTMLAAESFDPRLMWDAAANGLQHEEGGA